MLKKCSRSRPEYILDVFSYYNPKLVIATHSPLIISSSKIHESDSNVFLVKNNRLFRIDSNENGLESMLWEYFEIITPENNFLSNYLVNIISDLKNNKISLNYVKERLEELRRASYDQLQIEIFEKVYELAEKVDQSRA